MAVLPVVTAVLLNTFAKDIWAACSLVSTG